MRQPRRGSASRGWPVSCGIRMLRRSSATALLLLTLSSVVDPADARHPNEYQIKAAFLYNFAKFVKWPEDGAGGTTFVIGVLGQDPFGEVLDQTFAGKTILEKQAEVRRFTDVASASKAQILFVGSSETPHLAQVLHSLQGTHVLTVGDIDGFADRGGMIAFRLRDDFVRFDINLDEAKLAQLKISSQLIRVAQRVISTDGGN
jgi:hypothetical protein